MNPSSRGKARVWPGGSAQWRPSGEIWGEPLLLASLSSLGWKWDSWKSHFTNVNGDPKPLRAQELGEEPGGRAPLLPSELSRGGGARKKALGGLGDKGVPGPVGQAVALG